MARRPPALRNSRDARPGVVDSLIEGAGELVQSVANDVVPGVVRAIDVDEVVQRIDLDKLLEHVDLDAVLERVDIDALLARTQIGDVVSRSGSAVAGRVLDALRSQGVGLDAFIGRWTDRILPRRRDRAMTEDDLQGVSANVATRAAAFMIDLIVVTTVFSAGGAVVERMLGLVLGRDVEVSDSRVLYGVALAAWAFLYSAYPLSVAGRTLGMCILGLRTERVDGSVLGVGAVVVRVVTLPLSFLLLGLGFLLIVVRRDHRALHDLLSGAVVVYSWPARPAHLRFLVREQPPVA